MKPLILVVEKRNGRLAVEELMLSAEADRRDIPVITTPVKKLARNQIPLTKDHVVAGGVLFVKHALRAYGKELSEHTPYPPCLAHLLYRNVRQVRSLRDAKELLDKGESFFIKPATWKSFTGFVAQFSDDFRFNGASNSIPVFISEVVEFVSEWRTYVANGQIVGFCSALNEFRDDDRPKPDMTVIKNAVDALTAAGAPAGYVVDFGVLSTGETALVELNDGFSIGAYVGVTSKAYWEVIVARWQQLIAD